MSKKILILFAHPRYEHSRISLGMLKYLPQDRVTFRDLYEDYPDFNIDIEREKVMLETHDIVVWHHPFYWYSSPPLLKQWIDLVLEFGWAYGPGGTALSGKWVFNCITTGGGQHAYSREGHNVYSIQEFMYPFERTAKLCKMEYLPPFVVHGAHKLSPSQIEEAGQQYRWLLEQLADDQVPLNEVLAANYLNDWVIQQRPKT